MSTLRTLRKARRTARRTEVLLGDAIAIGAGRAPQRTANRILGRLIGRATRRLWL